MFETCLEVNKAVISEDSRLVTIIEGEFGGKRLRDALEPRRGGTARVTVIYRKDGAVCEIDLRDEWMVHCSQEFVNELKHLPGVQDAFLVTAAKWPERPEIPI